MECFTGKNKKVSVIIPAAGSAARMQGINKTFYELAGEPVLLRTVRLFEQMKSVGEIIIVVKKGDIPVVNQLIERAGINTQTVVAEGGGTRCASVGNGLKASNPSYPFVAIHDAARPFCQTTDIEAVFSQAFLTGAAALGMPVKDTVKLTENAQIIKTLPREKLVAIQTPQVFDKEIYQKAIREAEKNPADYTDDCQLVEALGIPVAIVSGSDQNFKLTTPFDLKVAEIMERDKGGKNTVGIRIGHGYDVHRLKEGRKLILGGVTVPFQKGLDGHSDADVLAHAVMDALLGALALGDIGKHFPDNDAQYLNCDSMILMERVAELLQENGWRVGNLDATILAQAPKLSPFISRMRENIARVLHLPVCAVSIKATTEEGLGFTGNGEGVAAHAVCILEK